MEVLFPGSADIARRFQVGLIELDAGTASVINGVTVTPFLMKHACSRVDSEVRPASGR
jgi:hypothetical protein